MWKAYLSHFMLHSFLKGGGGHMRWDQWWWQPWAWLWSDLERDRLGGRIIIWIAITWLLLSPPMPVNVIIGQGGRTGTVDPVQSSRDANPRLIEVEDGFLRKPRMHALVIGHRSPTDPRGPTGRYTRCLR